MKLRDVSIKVAFNFEKERKLYKWFFLGHGGI